jgi:hypothetical protein
MRGSHDALRVMRPDSLGTLDVAAIIHRRDLRTFCGYSASPE